MTILDEIDEEEEDDLQLLQPDVKFICYVTCDNAVKSCAGQTVDQILDE
jgi:hypothetical protein